MSVSFYFLNFIANMGIILPYFIVLNAYNYYQRPLLLVVLIVIYASRSIGVILLNTRFTPLNNLLMGTVTGMLGAGLLSLFQLNLITAIFAGILLGYHSSTLWPLFLAGKTDLSGQYKINKRNTWLVFLALVLGLIIILTSLIPRYSYQINFSLYLLLCLLSIPAAFKMTRAILSKHEPVNLPKRSNWLLIAAIILFASRLVLYMLSKNVLLNYWPDLIAIGLLILLTLKLIIVNRNYDNRLTFALTLLRGALMTYVLFFAPFYGFAWFKSNATLFIYGLYLLGFESGAIIVKKLSIQPIFLLGLGLILSAMPFKSTYLLGILACTVYLGYLNPYLNEQHIHGDIFNRGSGIIHKYHLSTFGSQIGYAVIFLLLITFAYLKKVNITSFLMTKDATMQANIYVLNLILICMLLSFIILGRQHLKQNDI